MAGKGQGGSPKGKITEPRSRKEEVKGVIGVGGLEERNVVSEEMFGGEKSREMEEIGQEERRDTFAEPQVGSEKAQEAERDAESVATAGRGPPGSKLDTSFGLAERLAGVGDAAKAAAEED